jgi:hypothetical protein
MAVTILHDECKFLLSAPVGVSEEIEVFGRTVALSAGQIEVVALARP